MIKLAAVKMVFEKVKEEESSPALAFTASLDSGGEGIGIDGFLLSYCVCGPRIPVTH